MRLAEPRRDAPAVAAIYRPVVEETHISFEEAAPSPAEMEKRIRGTLERTPWLVAESEGEVAGYAYAASHRDRPAYRWSVDISAYVDAGWRGQGVGLYLYRELLEILRRQHFVNVYAGVALPNPARERLHRALWMELIGVFAGVGFKLGRWWDVAWYGTRLSDPGGSPTDPIPLPRLREAERPQG